MKILFTCNEFPPYPNGGFGTFVKEIAKELTRQKHQVFVYGIYPISKRKTTVTDGITFIEDPINGKGYLGSLLQLYNFGKAVNKIIKKHQIDIVETDDTKGWFLFINKAKLFVRLHSSNLYFKKNRGRFIALIEHVAFQIKKPRIIAVSQFILEEFNKKFNANGKIKNIAIIPNGIMLTDTNLKTKKKKSIVFAGTIKPMKGVNYLIDAFIQSGLQQEYTLDLYGKDTNVRGKSYSNQLLNKTTQIQELVAAKTINYHGIKTKKEILTKFNEAEICVFPSEFESFGLVVIEAMSVGAIVIYTNQGAAKEIVTDNSDAFLVPIKNSKAIAKKLQFITKMDKKAKENIRENAKKRAQQFSIASCATQSLNFYNIQND